MNKDEKELERELSSLKNVASRDPNAAIRGRNLFLAEAKRLSQTVSLSSAKRHTQWNKQIQIKSQKGRFAMVSIITTIVVALALLFGGTGVVQAAQSSMPEDVLYPVKLWSEDVALDLVSDPQQLISLYLNYASRRIEELASLTQSGGIVDEALISRLMLQIESSLQIATELDENKLEQAFLQIRDQLRIQEQIMQQLQIMASDENEPLMTRTRQVIQERLMLIENGLKDPVQLRQTIREQIQIRQQLNQPEDAQSGSMNGEGNGYGSNTGTAPEAGTGGNSYGQQSTPGPNPEGGSGYGQGLNNGQCICEPTPTGTVYYGFGTPTPTLCVCPTGIGNGSMGTPNPGGNGQGGKP